MKYGTLCSGIEGAAVAFADFGWQHAYCAEVDGFCCDLLAHHYPGVPNLGDITTAQFPAVDLIVAGTPCQSFSVAGNRAGLDDPRGQLALRFVEILRETKPQWIIWENVPGVLSSSKGADFAAFIGALSEVGYGLAWRVLDARFFGVAQRRRRVFVVGYLGAHAPAESVLFESPTGCGTAATPGRVRPQRDGVCGYSQPLFGWTATTRTVHVLDGMPVLCQSRQDKYGVAYGSTVRRLTVTEWERLQGFPDGYTAIGRGDGLRRKALGNSFAVPVMRWIGQRLKAIQDTLAFLD